MPCIQSQKDGTLLLALHVQPRAAKNELTGMHDGALKLRLTTPPVDGKANKAVITFLSGILGLPRSSLTLHSGARNRRKLIRITGTDENAVRKSLGAVCPALAAPDSDSTGNK